MIFALFFLQSISIAFGTVTNVHDIETVISSYLFNTIDQHTLHATSTAYMQIVQDESHVSSRYFQSVRYMKHGFPMYPNSSSHTNSTNDIVYKKLNFVQSIAYCYCGIKMSSVMHPSLDNIFINKSQLFMNSTIFPIQLVESYELTRSEICERIKRGSYTSAVGMFKPILLFNSNHHSFFRGFARSVSNFVSSPHTYESFSMDSIGYMYQFLAKFGKDELYKDTVFYRIVEIYDRYSDIDTCVNRIKHPKMYTYATSILNSTGDQPFILNGFNTSDFSHYVQMYQFSTGVNPLSQVEDNIVKVRNLLQLIDQCQITTVSGATTGDCPLIAFRIHELRNDGVNGHEYVLNVIKCTISNHHVYCSKFANETDYQFTSTSTNNLRELLSVAVLYPYLNELMNDNQFINIVNNNTNSEIDTYLQTTLCKLMMVALEQYKDFEMIKKIATAFKPKINVDTICIRFKSECNPLQMSLMDTLRTYECGYLIKYFQQMFTH